ncbi:TolC family outer membrane protein [Roseibium sp.]|uniref:TolC family outer membrane protein n=1 Tax=Roseibium sp. TaxID=1936156 RepID=UPI003A985A24
MNQANKQRSHVLVHRIVRSVLPCASLILGLAAAPVWAQTLQDAMSSAYQVNPGLKAERSRFQATQQGVWTARSQFLPTITGTYLGEHSASDRTRSGTSDRSAFHELGINLSQPLFQGFSAVNRLNQAHEETASGYSQLLGAEQSLLFDTANAYLRVLRDRAILDRLRSYTGVVQQEVNAARARYNSGDATRTDIEQALARLAEAEGNRDQAVGDLEASLALYERLTGSKPGKLGWPSVPKRLQPKGLQDAIAIAQRNNPTIRAATSDARAARYAARASVGDMLPRVTLESAYDTGYRGNLGNRDEEEFRLGVRVTAPLFSGGRNIAAVKAAKATASQQEYALDDIQQTIRETVIRAVRQETAARQRADAAQRAINANQRAIRGLQVEFEGGQRSLLDVLDGQRELLNSKVSFERARFDASLAEFFLLATIGRLDPTDFSIVEERPEQVSRIIPEFNSWTLRLQPTEGELARLEIPLTTGSIPAQDRKDMEPVR